MKLCKIKNASLVRQTVPGWGQADPGECLLVAPDAARHLLASGAWKEIEGRRQRRAAKKTKEVTNDAA